MVTVIALNSLEENGVCNVVETCTDVGTHCLWGHLDRFQHPSLSQTCAGMARLCE